MTTSYIQPTFSVGELAPSLYGRTDLQAFHRGASTMRNCFVDYKGGASSRAGTAFVGRCLQSGSDLPPVDIPFRVSLTENYVLEFGNFYMRVKANGGYVLEFSLNISAATQASPCVITVPGHTWSAGDWIYIESVGGMTRLNRRTFIILSVNGNDLALRDIFNVNINSLTYSAYTSGGTASRLFTLTTPYSSSDLAALKYAQDATVMTLVHKLHAPYDLERVTASSWTLTAVSFGTSISAPASLTVAASSTTATNLTAYSYVVTAIDAETGEESVASPLAGVTNSVNINSLLGTLKLEWPPVSGASSYNIYKAPVSIDGTIPVGVIYGYIATALGVGFVDTNVTADFALCPPLHSNPFVVNAIAGITVTAGGAAYTAATLVTVNTTTGSGAVLQPVISAAGALVAVIVVNAGEGYASTDTVTITDSGGGAGASAFVVLGPSSGTYPGVVGYFQQRRVYAATLNDPDTYFMSKPGAFDNMDASAIANDSDSIIGQPWAQQIQGIQSIVPMPGGLVTFTGLGVWQVSGGSPGSAITPANQAAVPQAYNGCHQFLQPININFDILYVQSMGSVVRDLSYNLFANIYTGTDLSVLSNHLFENYRLISWTWAEEPFKLVWAVRDDGALLSLTYLKEQEIQGWSRHDTQGLFVSVCSIIEQPVNAVYTIARRRVSGAWWYFSERMNNRIWSNIEDCWCVDCAAALPQPMPAAGLTASAAFGVNSIGSIDLLLGGTGYTDPAVRIDDPTGTGAQLSATVVLGVITAITIIDAGEGYTSPKVIIEDDDGVGAAANATIANSITLSADAPIFSSTDVDKVFRGGGGRGTVSSFISPTVIMVDMDAPITKVIQNIPDDQDPVPLPISSGQWTLTTPVDTVYAEHLKGLSVCGLIDGNQVEDITVEDDGTITLPSAASSIVLGLEFVAQVQSMNAELDNQPTAQGKRKNIQGVTLRLKSSRGVSTGANQPNASQQENQVNVPWTDLVEIPERNNDVHAGMAIPLFTGDVLINIPGQYGPDSKPGQACAQSGCALPMSLLAFIPEITVGDSNG